MVRLIRREEGKSDIEFLFLIMKVGVLVGIIMSAQTCIKAIKDERLANRQRFYYSGEETAPKERSYVIEQ